MEQRFPLIRFFIQQILFAVLQALYEVLLIKRAKLSKSLPAQTSGIPKNLQLLRHTCVGAFALSVLSAKNALSSSDYLINSFYHVTPSSDCTASEKIPLTPNSKHNDSLSALFLFSFFIFIVFL